MSRNRGANLPWNPPRSRDFVLSLLEHRRSGNSTLRRRIRFLSRNGRFGFHLRALCRVDNFDTASAGFRPRYFVNRRRRRFPFEIGHPGDITRDSFYVQGVLKLSFYDKLTITIQMFCFFNYCIYYNEYGKKTANEIKKEIKLHIHFIRKTSIDGINST